MLLFVMLGGLELLVVSALLGGLLGCYVFNATSPKLSFILGITGAILCNVIFVSIGSKGVLWFIVGIAGGSFLLNFIAGLLKK